MKPILFNTEMVRAILDGRKSCTRRIAKHIKSYEIDENGYVFARIHNHAKFISFGGGTMQMFLEKFAPYQAGDILCVREKFCPNYFDECIARNRNGNKNAYKADYNKDVVGDVVPEPKWHPSIHMPKEAARLFLKVTDVRVERLQDITEEQARADGCIDFHDKIGNGNFDDVLEFDLTARDAFAELWNSTVDKKQLDQYGWNANPYVWVIEFERCEKPEVAHED